MARTAADAQPDSTQPARSGLSKVAIDVLALVLSLVAVVASVRSCGVSQRADEREQIREKQDLARQVIFHRTNIVEDLEPGSKPRILGQFLIVANFGKFPIEDVGVESSPTTLYEELGKPEYLTPDAPQIRVLQLGTIGPCQKATVRDDIGFDETAAVFTDINGEHWTKMEGRAPQEGRRQDHIQRDPVTENFETKLEDLGSC
jgi:hypothetical protein